MNKKVIIIGASGHGKVIADIVVKCGDEVAGFLDDGIEAGTNVLGYPILGKTDICYKYKDECEFIIGIGSQVTRKKIVNLYQLNWYTAIHPEAYIGTDVSIDKGSVVMAKVVINVSSSIGKHCIINTGAIIEHDNVIEDYVHVSPHATLCGTVNVGEMTHIGASSTVINNISICSHCMIGAGSVVVKDILEKGTYVGVPAKKL